MNIIEREIEQNWYLIQILNINIEKQEITGEYLDNNKYIEDGISYDEVRTPKDRIYSWKYILLGNNTYLNIDDIIERDIDNEWYEVNLLEINLETKSVKIQYHNGNVEDCVSFNEIRNKPKKEKSNEKKENEQQQQQQEQQNNENIPAAETPKITSNNYTPISFNTQLKVLSIVQKTPHYKVTESLSDDILISSRKRFQSRRRTKSEDNILANLIVSNVDVYSSPFDKVIYPPRSTQFFFPFPIGVPRIRRKFLKTYFQPPSFTPFAGYCEKCCKITIYRCKRCGISYFCSRSCQISEWKTSHWKLCIPTPFIPVFKFNGNSNQSNSQVEVYNSDNIPEAADTTQTEWKSSNYAPVRYCQTYPDLKVSAGTQINFGKEEGPDWLYDDVVDNDDVNNCKNNNNNEKLPPPCYEEATKQNQEGSFVEVDFLSIIPESQNGNSVDICDTSGFQDGKDSLDKQNHEANHSVSPNSTLASSLSEMFNIPISDSIRVLKSVGGNIDKAVEWFFEGNSVANLPPEVIVPEYGHRTRMKPIYTNQPLVSAVPLNSHFDNESKEQELPAYSKLESSDELLREEYRQVHPNRANFLVRENVITIDYPITSFPVLIFSGIISINGRLCHGSLHQDNEKFFLLRLTPTDPITGFICLDDEPPTDDSVIADEIFLSEYTPFLRVSKIRPIVPDGPIAAVIDQLIEAGKLELNSYGSDYKYSMSSHDLNIHLDNVLTLMNISLFEYERRINTSIAQFGRDLFDKILLGLKTTVLNPFSADHKYSKYVIIIYQIFAVQTKSNINQSSKFISQSVKQERVPCFDELVSKASYFISNKKLFPEGWGEIPIDTSSGVGNASTYDDIDNNDFNSNNFSSSAASPFTPPRNNNNNNNNKFVITADDSVVQQLMDMMALDRATALRALNLNSGDINEAIDWIIQGMPERLTHSV